VVGSGGPVFLETTQFVLEKAQTKLSLFFTSKESCNNDVIMSKINSRPTDDPEYIKVSALAFSWDNIFKNTLSLSNF
jgi:hypothetical protein